MSMIEDTMRSVKPYLEELLPHYPVVSDTLLFAPTLPNIASTLPGIFLVQFLIPYGLLPHYPVFSNFNQIKSHTTR